MDEDENSSLTIAQREAIKAYFASPIVRNARLSVSDSELAKALEGLGPEAQSRLTKLLADAQKAIDAATDGVLDDETPAVEAATDTGASAAQAPPRFGEVLVGLFCRRDMREAVLGDLDEKFAELAERRGARAAKAWYWGQSGRSVLFFAVRWGRRLLELEAILKRIL